MKLRDYRKNITLIRTAAAILLIAAPTAVYIFSDNTAAAVICLLSMLSVCVLICVQSHTDDKYIIGVVDDLSRLCDNLITLEEKEIFPENEDTMLSKLQNKILKLVRILKHKNESSLAEQENIKALVSDISHQLKTPIANLKMYTDFLKDESISEEQRKEYTEIIGNSVERLNFLSESMIKISRLEGGLINLHRQLQSLNETVMISIKDVFSKAKVKNIELSYSGESIDAYHDRRWTAEAIFNLLDNAVKYSDSGTMISITVKRFGMFASVEVKDQNKPVPENERSRIFTRFYRGMNSRSSDGIGIGLYLAREIALKQGGYMNLSARDNGNTFSIILPVEK